MKINKVILFRHVFIWTLFIVYELLLIRITVGELTPFLYYMKFYVLNILLFYFNAHVILDYSFFKTRKPYLIATGLIIIEILTFLLIKLKLENFLAGGSGLNFNITAANERLWLTNIFREIFFIGFSIAYWSMLYMVKFKERNHFMEKESLKQVAHSLELENKYITAENAYLQNQISPHLLFNTLNFVYNAIHKLSDRAGKGVMLLSELMRYSLLSSQDNRLVDLTEEVRQIEKLVELSALRFDSELFLRFTKKGKMKVVLIPPLILVTLVENMLKHGDLGEKSDPGKISLEVTENTLRFTTQNLKRQSTPHPPSGLGLRNIEKRLANLFPKKHRFTARGDEHFYFTELILNL